jgi:hypothetical protein
MRRVVCIVVAAMTILTVVASNAQVQQKSKNTPPFWDDLKPGPYTVGFRVLYHRDRSRKWLKEQGPTTPDPGRPIRVSVWYPALPSKSNQRMTYGDYLHHHGPNDFRQFDGELDKMDSESWLSDLRELTPPGQPMFDKLLSTPTAAYGNAPAAHGDFPLVLYSGGKASRADDNVELGEYLASYGYVVATVPQLGPSDHELELGSSPPEISLHADDFDAALAVLHTLPEIKFGHIATAGHSAGGEVAVELALRHPDLAAVIGLDASYGMTGGARVFKQLPEYAPGRQIGAALLDLRRANGSQGATLDLGAIDALHWTDVYRVTFEKAYHGDFTQWGMVALKLSIPMPPNPYGHTRQIGYDVNRRACHAVLDFLDAQLRGRTGGLDDLKAAMQHEPDVTFSHFSGSATPSTEK